MRESVNKRQTVFFVLLSFVVYNKLPYPTMLASSDAPLFNLAAMDADLALANAQQPQQRHSNSANNNNSTRSRPRAASYLLRRASDLTTSSSADKRPSVSSVLLSQLASSLDHELHDPDDAFDAPLSHVGLLGTSPTGTNSGTKPSTTSATLSGAGGGRRSRARASVCILPPPPSSKMGGSGLPGPLRKEAYRRARSCPLEPHAELPHRNALLDANHDSLRCLQVPPRDDMLSLGDVRGKNLDKRILGQDQENINTPLASQIAASIHLTDAELSERTAALNFILTNPAHFRQLQSDLRSSSVITHCSSVVLDQLLSERVARMRQVREEALQKMREDRDREREYARQMGIPLDDEDEDGTDNGGMGKDAKGKGVAGWDHLLVGLTSVANLGAGFLNKQSSTLSDEQHTKHRQQLNNHHNHTGNRVHDDDGMDWNIDQPGMAAPKRPSSIVALQDIQTSQRQQQEEQGKKTSLSTVAETMSRSSSGDFSLGEEQMQQMQEVAAVRKASLDSSAAASLCASYSFSSKSSTSLSSLVEGTPSAPPTAAGPTNTKASAEVATRRGGRRRSLVARGA